ncbi:MAG: homoserine dehydrogenase [Acidobacteria bacterium]|nr:homoserine dehydrogenase [Acidobacteriota bacterium]
MSRPELALALVGFGHVGQRFLRLLDEVADRLDFDWRLVAIATRRHGCAVDADGIDADRALATMEGRLSLERLDHEPQQRSGIDVVRRVTDVLADEASEGRLVTIETTLLDIEQGEPATAHVRASLEGLAHVVTANKGPVAFGYRDLESLAESVDRFFLFEGAVMDGVPVFNLVRETMPGVVVEAFRGVINSTCNYVLAELERGTPFDDAIAAMQAQGIAEADPSHDVDGWDAAAKTAALANVLLDAVITPHQVERTGIRDVTAADASEAVASGRRIRLVASAARHGRTIEARVEPELLDGRDPLANLTGTENALYLKTDLLGEIGVVQRTGSVAQTAYALLSDVMRISRRFREL